MFAPFFLLILFGFAMNVEILSWNTGATIWIFCSEAAHVEIPVRGAVSESKLEFTPLAVQMDVLSSRLLDIWM